MIVELVTFKAPPGADWDDILTDARASSRAGAPTRISAQAFPAVRGRAGMRRPLHLADARGGRSSARCRMARRCRTAHRSAADDSLFRAADVARQRGRDRHRVVENRRKGRPATPQTPAEQRANHSSRADSQSSRRCAACHNTIRARNRRLLGISKIFGEFSSNDSRDIYWNCILGARRYCPGHGGAAAFRQDSRIIVVGRDFRRHGSSPAYRCGRG